MVPRGYELQPRHLSDARSEWIDDHPAGNFASSEIDEFSVAGDGREHDSNQRIARVKSSARARKVWSKKRALPLLMTVAAFVAVSRMSPNTAGVKARPVSNADKAIGSQATTDDLSSIVVKSEDEEGVLARRLPPVWQWQPNLSMSTTLIPNKTTEVEDKKEEGEKEEGKEEAVWTVTDVQVAGMLMGACFMVMILFQVVNWPDDDIRFYAWSTISAVVSIFVAVLMFSNINDCILYQCELWLPTKKSPSISLCIVQYIHLTVWACLLQFVCAYLSGAICDDTRTNPMLDQFWVLADNLRHDYEKKIHGSFVRRQDATKSYTKVGEIAVRRSFPEGERRNRQVKCWGMLFAHTTGFAAINSGGCMQHLELFSSSPGMALIPILINQLYINALFYIFVLMRKSAEEAAKSSGRQALRAKLFNEEVSESEIDICSLGWSFLLIQVVRYMLVGEMPTMTGETLTPNNSTIGVLFLIGVGFAMGAVVTILVRDSMKGTGKKQEEEEEEGLLARYVEIFIAGLSMCFAWCFLFGGRWLYSSIDIFKKSGCSMETVVGRVLLATFICTFVLCFIFLLDKIDDLMDDQLPGGSNVVRQIITALAVLAGFSWEHAFDGGVEAIAAQTDFPLTVTAILSLAVFVVVVPAWRRHILQKYMILLALRKEARVKTTAFDSPAPAKLMGDNYTYTALQSVNAQSYVAPLSCVQCGWRNR